MSIRSDRLISPELEIARAGGVQWKESATHRAAGIEDIEFLEAKQQAGLL